MLNGDGNENGKKTLHVQNSFFNFFAVVLREYSMKLPFNQIIKQDYLKCVLQIILPVSHTVIRHFQFTGSGDTFARLPVLYSSHNSQGPTTPATIEVKS